MMNRRDFQGFTLIELLVSTTIVILITLMLVSATSQTGALWTRTKAKVEQFREARTGFETLTQRLGQATLNTYWDYNNPTLPTRYQRRSELRFTSGQADTLLGPDGENRRLSHCVFFHAPIGFTAVQTKAQAADTDKAGQGYRGLDNLLNCWGYFVQFGNDQKYRPEFLNGTTLPLRWRFRLMEFALPTESLATYNLTSGVTSGTAKAYRFNKTDWFTRPLAQTANGGSNAPTVHTLAENIVALVIMPRLPKREEEDIGGSSSGSPLAPQYSYDSSPITTVPDSRYRDGRLNPINQLPPVVQVTMVAVDEGSALRLNLTRDSWDVFHQSDKFRSSSQYERDLHLTKSTPLESDPSLEAELIKKKVNYRIFTSNVPIRAAKWSRAQVEP